MTERTNDPSTTIHEAARHNNKSPCTDGEVAEMVSWLLDQARRYSDIDLRKAADLLTSLSAERAEIAQALAFRGNVTSDRDRLSWCVAIAIDTLRDRAERAEAERDALKAEKHELMRSGLALMGDLKAAKEESDALKARVAELEAGLIEALKIIDPIADVVKCARLYALSGDRK